MQYQIVKQLKTTHKTVSVHATLQDAVNAITRTGARFEEISYIGRFPVFRARPDGTVHPTYSIQGLTDIGVVCSLPTRDIEAIESRTVANLG